MYAALVVFVVLMFLSGISSIAVILLTFTKWGSSVVQLLLSLFALCIGLVLFFGIHDDIGRWSVLVYLPGPSGALGLCGWLWHRYIQPR
jgi:hypothetical protein